MFKLRKNKIQDPPKNSGSRRNKYDWLILISSVLAVIIFLALIFFTVIIITAKLKTSDYFFSIGKHSSNIIGDFFAGFFGAFTGFLGVLLLIATLRNQRKEFEKTRLLVLQQSFESSFYHMLGMANEIKLNISYGKREDLIHGDRAVHIYLKELKDCYVGRKDTKMVDDTLKKIEKVNLINQAELSLIRADMSDVFSVIYRQHHYSLSHFFRYIHQLLEFVDSNMIFDNDNGTAKFNYFKQLSSQLSNDELALLYYYSISNECKSEKASFPLHELLDRIQFFKLIDDDALILREHHVLFSHTYFKFLSPREVEERPSLETLNVYL